MPDLIRHPCVKGDGPRVKPGVTEGEVKPGVTEKSVVCGATQKLVMPDLIRHPCLHGGGPRVKPGVKEGEVKPAVTREGVMPVVITEGGVREKSGMKHPHMRATPKLVAPGWRAAASKQVSRQKLSTLRVSRGSITPSSSTKPLV